MSYACQVPGCQDNGTEYRTLCPGHWGKVSIKTRDRLALSFQTESNFYDRDAAAKAATWEAVVADDPQMGLFS